MNEQELREKLAAIEHERWSDWQAWCHKILRENCPSPELEKVLERWDRQIATPYDKLSDQEKASDMEQVDRYWPLVAALVARREAAIRTDDAKRVAELSKKLVKYGDGTIVYHRNEAMIKVSDVLALHAALTTEATRGGKGEKHGDSN